MVADETIIRKAAPGDADSFYELLIMSSPAFESLFGESGEKALKNMFRARNNLFSHQHTVFADADGERAGMLLGYGCREKNAENLSTAALVLWELNVALISRLPVFIRCGMVVGIVNAGDYFISNVAVFPEFRGRGIATDLIARAEREAKKQGAVRLTLEVETHSAGAIRLYEKLGFHVTEEMSVDIGEKKSFFRMAKPVSC